MWLGQRLTAAVVAADDVPYALGQVVAVAKQRLTPALGHGESAWKIELLVRPLFGILHENDEMGAEDGAGDCWLCCRQFDTGVALVQ